MKPTLRPLLLQALLAAWLLLSVFFFVLISRVDYMPGFLFPDSLTNAPDWLTRLQPLSYLWNTLRALLGVTLFGISALGLGLAVLRWPELTLARLVTAFVVGEIFFSLIFLTLIHFFKITPLISGLILAGGFSGVPFVLRAFADSQTDWRKLPLAIFRRNEFRSTLPWLIFGLALLLSATRLGYDAVAEYFSHPKIMALTGAPILLYPSDGFVVSSLQPGILFTPLIQLFGDQSARLLSWFNGLAIALAGLALAQKVGLSPRARHNFLILLFTSTFFVDLLGEGKVELISSAPLLIALYWMLESRQQPTARIFGLIGFLLGFAILARPYNLFLVPVFTLLFYLFWAAQNMRAHGIKTGLRASLPLLWMLPPLLALGIFHLWQNALWLGSPLAPLTYAQQLDSGDWQWQFDPQIVNLLRLLYPLTLTFFNTPQSLGNLSPLVVGALPFLAWPTIRRGLQLQPAFKDLLLAALLTLAAWVTLFFTVVEIRYVLFLWVLLFLPAAQLLKSAQERAPQLLKSLLRALPALLLLFMATRTLLIAVSAYAPVDSDGWAHCANGEKCTFFEPLNQLAAPGERVLVLHAFRYYLRPDLFTCASRSDEYLTLQALRASPADFWEAVYRQGFRYLTFEKHFAEFRARFGSLPDSSQAPAWLKVETIASASEGNLVLYRLTALQPPAAPVAACQKGEAGLWQVVPAK